MPKGVPLPCMMDNEIVAMFYHCLSNVDRNLINFDNVAAAVGEATAGKAKDRLQRMMKAQEKGAAGKTTLVSPKKTSTKPQKSETGTGGVNMTQKKRKAKATETVKHDNVDGEDETDEMKLNRGAVELPGARVKRLKVQNTEEDAIDGGEDEHNALLEEE